MVKSTHLQLNI